MFLDLVQYGRTYNIFQLLVRIRVENHPYTLKETKLSVIASHLCTMTLQYFLENYGLNLYRFCTEHGKLKRWSTTQIIKYLTHRFLIKSSPKLYIHTMMQVLFYQALSSRHFTKTGFFSKTILTKFFEHIFTVILFLNFFYLYFLHNYRYLSSSWYPKHGNTSWS